MTPMNEYLKKIERLKSSKGPYKAEAFDFVVGALQHTVKKLAKPRHVSAHELLEGIREFALEQFGPMAGTVMKHWGIRTTLDYGKIVFALVDSGFMSKNDNDHLDDFKDVFELDEVFNQTHDWTENMGSGKKESRKRAKP